MPFTSMILPRTLSTGHAWLSKRVGTWDVLRPNNPAPTTGGADGRTTFTIPGRTAPAGDQGASLLAARHARSNRVPERTAGPDRDPRLLPGRLESRVWQRTRPLQRTAPRVPAIRCHPAGRLGGRCLVPHRLRPREQTQVPSTGGFRAQGRGRAGLWRVPPARQIGRAS